MDFQESVKTCFRKYATFAGRARRSEFWYWQLFALIGGIVFAIVDEFIMPTDVGAFGWIFAVVTLCPDFAVGARRLHDIGKSGWWQFLLLVPIVGWIVLVIWWARRGVAGDNRFGVDPIAAVVAEPALAMHA